MKKPRNILWLIVMIAVLAVFVDLPSEISINWQIGKWRIERKLERPPLNMTLGPFKFKRDLNVKEGLDLAGGSHLVFQAQTGNVPSGDRDRALEAAKEIIDRRVNFFGVSEPIVQTSKTESDYRIIVELPGVQDVDEAVGLIGQTAQLTFREEEASPSAEATGSALLFGPFTKLTDLTGKHLRRSEVTFDSNTSKPQVSLEFSPDGATLFEEITKRNVGKPVAIFLDDQLVSAPQVNEIISGGEAVINGDFTVEEAKKLSIQLNAGALPLPLKIIEQRNIGATLGQESLRKSLIAGLIGLGTVVLFMIFYYGRMGIFASLALLIYTLSVMAIFKLIPVTLTLAGIAGFILSIGMAVDANILIFERMREELRWGKTRHVAVELGFSRAWTSIRDSNVSSLITCAILYYFGTGIVRGFALTLALGIMISMFSAIIVTRTFLRIANK
ncbi:MAG: protein translocase subunit SecD [bacterium]|nr:protein translocase subunit SecD [bacterium]